ncbi:MAG: hypothetical protein CMB68_03830 [Euryarchaeota archaeon]|nr:hypothetical protein [Euryarchaeota archaeon]|tara:strand:- start:6084 stop:6947 length:864 start_codon:yes stop_codon:yes gene_type:complete
METISLDTIIPNRKMGRLMSRPLVCVTLRGYTVDDVLKDAAVATAAGADLVEVRLDLLWAREQDRDATASGADADSNDSRGPKYEPPEIISQPLESVDIDAALASLKQGIDLPVVLTCRPERQGGHYPGEEAERIEVLSSAISSGVSWIDLEVDIVAESRKSLIEATKGKTKIIASLHSVENPPSASEIIQDVEDSSDMGDIVKLCYNTSGRADGLRLFEASWDLKETEYDYAIMGSGWGGDWTRIHAPILGQALVYATMEKGFHLSRMGRINASDLQMAWKLLEYE